MGTKIEDFIDIHKTSLLESQRNIFDQLKENSIYDELNDFLEKKEYYPLLIRMPTGTGKTGIIAITTYFANHSGSTLILTPWSNLCSQLCSNINLDSSDSFWRNFQLDYKEKELIVNSERFYPTSFNEKISNYYNRRFVLVGTLNGLQTLQRKHKEAYEELKKLINLVIVDEGHYEPAVLWGRAIKKLNLPTILLTATPYRNDLKLFKVPSKKVFHFTHEQSLKMIKKPLRLVEDLPLTKESTDLEGLLSEFLINWEKIKKDTPVKNPRTIICCKDKHAVKRTIAFIKKNPLTKNISILGFHDRVEEEDFKNDPELREYFVRDVPIAKETNEEIWIHQRKLTEGVDDPRFICVLFTYPLKNDRKLVQQVGRILRYSSDIVSTNNEIQKAFVFHCSDYPFWEIWNNYLEFEKLKEVITGEHYRKIILEYLKLLPPFEYFDKRFRRRLEPFIRDNHESWIEDAKNNIVLLPRVLVYKTKPDFDFNDFVNSMTDSILLRDGIILNSVGDDRPSIYDENGTVLWIYALFKNPRILRNRSAYEISIESRVIQKIENYIYISDSSGSSYGDYIDKFAMKTTYFDLSKAISKDYVIKQVSLLNTQSMNTVIRRTIRQGINVDDSPYQISEKKYICQNIRGRKTKLEAERYFGLTTGRISDRLLLEKGKDFTINNFIEWTKNVHSTLNLPSTSGHTILERFARISEAPQEAIPHFLILDTSVDLAEVYESTGSDVYDDSMKWYIDDGEIEVDIDEAVFEFENNSDDENWPYLITVTITNKQSKELAVAIKAKYDETSERFKFSKGKQSDFQVLYRKNEISLVNLLNKHHDRYLITLSGQGSNLIYNNKNYFILDYSNAKEKFLNNFTYIENLKNTKFEKIPSKMKKNVKKELTDWPTESVFHVTVMDIIKKEIPTFDLIYCDDPQREIADFIVVSFQERKAYFLHCKYGRGKKLSVSVFHDLCSQAGKNLIFVNGGRIPPNINKWKKGEVWEKTKIDRWKDNGQDLPQKKEIWEKIVNEILIHPQGNIEIWLIMGNGLVKNELIEKINKENEPYEIGPLLHLLDGLIHNCIESNTTLKIFTN